MNQLKFSPLAIWSVVSFSLLLNSGCVATQDWVQTWVNEQLFPINKRVSETEAGLTKVDGKVTAVDARVDSMAKQISNLENRLNQTNAKADRALESLQHLQVERKLVLDMKQGSFFASNSTVLNGQAKKEIDSFLSDLRGDSDGMRGLLFVVTGHTDNAGSERQNFELARIRAENAASYLAKQKKIDPAQLVVMSYGESVPIADNRTEAGRAKNRRVEILVYKESVAVEPAAADPRGSAKPR